MNKIFPKVAVVCLVSLSAFFLGCDTTEGIGRDLQDAGEAIEEAAQDAQDSRD